MKTVTSNKTQVNNNKDIPNNGIKIICKTYYMMDKFN